MIRKIRKSNDQSRDQIKFVFSDLMEKNVNETGLWNFSIR